MSTDPGWHADPINAQRLRYWDGTAWTDDTADINLKEQIVKPAVRKVTPHKWLWVGIAVAVVLAAGATAAATFGIPALVAALSPERSTSPTPAAGPGSLSKEATDEEIQDYIDSLPPLVDADDTSEEESTDSWMEEQGYTTAISGNVYLKAFDPSDFTCGWLNCTYYEVYTEKGCPGGVFIEGSIVSDGVSVGLVNELTASLGAQGQAVFDFEDYTELGNGFEITGATCRT